MRDASARDKRTGGDAEDGSDASHGFVPTGFGPRRANPSARTPVQSRRTTTATSSDGSPPAKVRAPHAWPGTPPAPPAGGFPHTAAVQTGRLAWIAGLVLTLSPFMGWYVTTLPNGQTLAVLGWNTGALGKFVFFIGLVTLILEALREAGIELPPSVPEEFILIGLGAIASIFVLVRIASIPETYFPDAGRGIGVFVALLASFGLVAAGLQRLAANHR